MPSPAALPIAHEAAGRDLWSRRLAEPPADPESDPAPADEAAALAGQAEALGEAYRLLGTLGERARLKLQDALNQESAA